ncbi:hypothetical protein ACWDR9_14875 [Streptosporangium sandarakinum]
MTDAPAARRTSVTVEFAGARGGEAPLTWGQQAFWRLTRWLDDGDPYFNMPWTLPVPGRHDLDAVLAALRALQPCSSRSKARMMASRGSSQA